MGSICRCLLVPVLGIDKQSSNHPSCWRTWIRIEGEKEGILDHVMTPRITEEKSNLPNSSSDKEDKIKHEGSSYTLQVSYENSKGKKESLAELGEKEIKSQ